MMDKIACVIAWYNAGYNIAAWPVICGVAIAIIYVCM